MDILQDFYKYSAMPLIDFVCSGKGGRATVFAYGQTGSGKYYSVNHFLLPPFV